MGILFLTAIAYVGTFALGYFAGRQKSQRVPGMLRRVQETNAMVGVSHDGRIVMDFPEKADVIDTTTTERS